MKKYLIDLNEEQLKAATHTDGPLLLLAGAGSGKTKTIISRTLNLLDSNLAKAHNILVMTFTNKAAKEMKERGQKMLGEDKLMPEFTTFHSWGVRFLRSMDDNLIHEIGISKNFSILDTSEQIFILDKMKMKTFPESKAKRIKMKKFLLTLGNIQNNQTRYDSIENTEADLSKIFNNLDLSMMEDASLSDVAKIFKGYKDELRQTNGMDFEDLINFPIQILKKNKDLRNSIKDKYKYIMVDEFQDTNNSQLDLLFLLLNKQNNLCVVGDDSQSIYGWRGADIKHILEFKKYFNPNVCKSINLSINYRSSQIIVEKANKLLTFAQEIHSDKSKLTAFKKLEGKAVKKIFNNPEEEAEAIASRIRFLKSSGEKDIAILYRTAMMSRAIELSLIRSGIPYSIHNGKTLLERKSAKTILAYLKFLHNTENSVSLSFLLINSNILSENRVISFIHEAELTGETLFSYLTSGNYKNTPRLGKLAINKVEAFLDEQLSFRETINNFETFKNKFFLKNSVKTIYDNMLLNPNQKEEKIIEANSNLNIISMIHDLSKKYSNLQSMLDSLSLDGDDKECEEDKVNLMTVHASKGLEFENLFVIGAMEGIFPSDRAIKENRLEEERRLFYVAITRSKHRLFISGSVNYHAQSKNLFQSRFINESHI